MHPIAPPMHLPGTYRKHLKINMEKQRVNTNTPQTYVLVGAGGTGSILVPLLLRYLDAYHTNHGKPYVLALIDGDHVEPKNLARQMFAPNFIDENKAEALATQIGHPAVRPIAEYLAEENLEHRIRNGDIVLIAADNYDVRRRLERHALSLENIVLVNGGNERSDGSLQVFIRADHENVTPPLSWQHPEILIPSPHDPSALNCAQRTEMPGGEQTIIANTMSAAWMLNALATYHTWTEQGGLFPWHELHFDLETARARPTELRSVDGWRTYGPQAVPA